MPNPRFTNQSGKPRKTWYNLALKNGSEPAALTIEGEIGDYGVSSAQFRQDFGRLGKDEAVKVHIKSGGGSIFDGNEIANILRDHKGEVTGTLGSICGSIATVIACACDKVVAAKNTMYMVHNPSVFAGGDSDEMRQMADIMDKLKGTITAAYSAKTGRPESEHAAEMDAETWMNSTEAKAGGYIDAISGDDADDDEIDNIDLTHYRNSASLLSKLQTENDASASGKGGNAKRIHTLRTLEAAAKNSATILPTKVTPHTMTPEEIAAQKDANELAIKNGIKAALDARNARDKEIKAAVALIAKRDKRDVSDIAENIFTDDAKTLADFYAAVASADIFKPIKGAQVIGGGAEDVVEPLDAYKGTPGLAFVNSEQFRHIRDQVRNNGGGTHFGVNCQITVPNFRNDQTTVATSGSGLTSIEKLPGVLELGVRPLVIEDLIAGGSTNNTTIRYIQEVTYTQAAGSVAELGTLAQVAMTYQEIDAAVKDMGGFVPMSENLLADYPAVASFINTRLPYQVDRAVDDQLLNGSGSGTDITGILNTSGIQTLALGSFTRGDLALKLQTLVRWQNLTAGQAQGGFPPDGYVIHPLDWETYMLLKDANGQYLFRGPFIGSYGQGAPVVFYTLWGLPVAVSPVVAQGTIVCGAWKMAAQKFDRQGLVIEMTNSNGTDFIQRRITVRGTRRLALAVYRPASFVTGTGL